MVRDDGNFLVLEAMLVAIVLFGAVAFLLYTPMPGESETLSQSAAEDRAGDVLRVLSGTPSNDGYETQLDELVTEAILGDTSGMSRLRRMLPTGAGFGMYLDNGVEPLTLYEFGSPTGAVESRDVLFYPDLEHGLAFATLENHHGTSSSDTLQVRVFRIENSYLNRSTVPTALVYENGRIAPLTWQSGVLTTSLVDPETPDDLEGYDTHYMDASTSWSARNASIATATNDTFGVVLDGEALTSVYHVDPDFVIPPTLASYAAVSHVSVSSPEVHPGETVTLTYDLAAIPLGGGIVTDRDVIVYGPIEGDVVDAQPLDPDLGGYAEIEIPRDALYGTYVVDTRIVFKIGSAEQVVHDVTSFDVLRPGTDAPSPPVYRVVLALWFNSL